MAEETRIKWIQTSNKAESIYTKLSELIASGTHAVEDTLGRVLEVLGGTPEYLKEEASKKGEQVKQTTGDYVKSAGEGVKKGGEKLKGEL